MLREIIETGKTVDAAIDSACEKLGCPRDEIEWEIISLPKKGFLGLVSSPAKVRVSIPVKEEPAPRPQANQQPARPARKDPPPREREARPAPKAAPPVPAAREIAPSQPSEPRPAGDREALAVSYLGDIMRAMGVQAEITTELHEEDMVVNVSGNGLGVMIGRRGETLDAIQYLTGLVVNRLEGDYLRVTIDCGNYRNKRRTTLEALARKIGGQVAKTGKSVTLEPMNPFERRVIHATVSEIGGVTSTSTGEGPGRRVVISSTEPGAAAAASAPRPAASRPRSSDRGGDNRRRGGGRRGPQAPRLDYLDIKDGGFKSAPSEDSRPDPAPQPRENARPVRRDNFIPNQLPREETPAPNPVSQPTPAPTKTIVDKEIASAPLYGKIDLE